MIKSKRIVALLLSVMLIISSMFTVVNAAADNAAGIALGSLTITKLENGRTDEDGNKLPLAGVKFKIYKVDDDESILQIPDKYLQEDYDSSSDENYYTAEAITGVDGKVSFSNLKLGRYLVVEEESPINVVYKTDNFLVDIPTTSVDGNSLIYNVEVYPKSETVYGGIILTKVNEKNEPMQGVKFILQTTNHRMADEGTSLGLMENVPQTRWAVPEWKTVTELKGEERVPKELITDENGQITLQGLPEGYYRFIETETLDGYILDNSDTYEFEVYLGDDSKTVVEPEAIYVKNEKAGIEKTITSVSRNENNTNIVKDGINSIDIGDTISYKLIVDIPTIIQKMNTFKITDTMDNGLTFIPEGMILKMITHYDDEEMEDIIETMPVEDIIGTDMFTYTEHSWILDIINNSSNFAMSVPPSKITLEITYDAILNSDAVAMSIGNNNKAELEYSILVNQDYNENSNGTEENPIPTKKIESSAKIYTGGFNIEKHALSRDGELLGGAVFKIATSEENAIQGNFIKDANGNEIVLTTGNGENGTELGKVSYKGLSYGTYYLLEVQAPTYEENGEVKYYNLLKDPIKIAVGEDTYEGLANVIVNKKGTLLPSTGGMGAVVFVAAGILFIVLGVTYYRKNRKEEV